VRDRWATGSGERRPGRFDRQVVDLPREAERRATATLVNHRSAPDRLTDLLLEREIIDGTHVDGIRGHVAGGRLPVGRPATRVQSITGASRGATA
jgi:ATP-dependent Zn protease